MASDPQSGARPPPLPEMACRNPGDYWSLHLKGDNCERQEPSELTMQRRKMVQARLKHGKKYEKDGRKRPKLTWAEMLRAHITRKTLPTVQFATTEAHPSSSSHIQIPPSDWKSCTPLFSCSCLISPFEFIGTMAAFKRPRRTQPILNPSSTHPQPKTTSSSAILKTIYDT